VHSRQDSAPRALLFVCFTFGCILGYSNIVTFRVEGTSETLKVSEVFLFAVKEKQEVGSGEETVRWQYLISGNRGRYQGAFFEERGSGIRKDHH
jgi:hypothetical protein